jgi:hypothetical protein
MNWRSVRQHFRGDYSATKALTRGNGFANLMKLMDGKTLF